ncbi:hypothetical protein J6590_035589 [Homalodisca vitripennis]|nr:hypothetical protein J6590_035589 [Homalodisca vitripennis]
MVVRYNLNYIIEIVHRQTKLMARYLEYTRENFLTVKWSLVAVAGKADSERAAMREDKNSSLVLCPESLPSSRDRGEVQFDAARMYLVRHVK